MKIIQPELWTTVSVISYLRIFTFIEEGCEHKYSRIISNLSKVSNRNPVWPILILVQNSTFKNLIYQNLSSFEFYRALAWLIYRENSKVAFKDQWQDQW